MDVDVRRLPAGVGSSSSAICCARDRPRWKRSQEVNEKSKQTTDVTEVEET